MVFVYSENRASAWFSTAFDDNLRIFGTTFSVKNRAEALQLLLARLSLGATVTGDLKNSHLDFAKKVVDTLENLLEGKPAKPSFILALNELPRFTQRVLNIVSRIPCGYVTTYSELAKAVGGGRAARAVAKSVATNPFLLLIPCHRVVPSDLMIGNYALGKTVKLDLIKREANKNAKPKSIKCDASTLKLLPAWKLLESNIPLI